MAIRRCIKGYCLFFVVFLDTKVDSVFSSFQDSGRVSSFVGQFSAFCVSCNQELITLAHLPYPCTLLAYNQASEKNVQIEQI